MKKIIISLFVLGFIVLPVVSFAQNDMGIAPVASEVALGVASITTMQISLILAFFILIPASLLGGILRLIGYRRDPKSLGWKFDIKSAVGKFFKYFGYHLVMVVFWATFLGRRSFNPYDDISEMGFIDSLLFFIGDKIASSDTIVFLIYALIFAVVGSFIVYKYNKLRKKPTFKPTKLQILRLFIWNIFVFVFLGFLFIFVFNAFGLNSGYNNNRDYRYDDYNKFNNYNNYR